MSGQDKIIPITSYDKATDSARIVFEIPKSIRTVSLNGTSVNAEVSYSKNGLTDALIALEKPQVINYLVASYESTATGLLLAGAGFVSATTVGAGSTQANGTALTKDLTIMTTVDSGQGVVLPTITAYRTITIINNGANALKVYGFKSSSAPDYYDYIGTTLGSTGVTIASGAKAVFYAKSTAVTNVSGKGWQQLI